MKRAIPTVLAMLFTTCPAITWAESPAPPSGTTPIRESRTSQIRTLPNRPTGPTGAIIDIHGESTIKFPKVRTISGRCRKT